jgi:hypothetical protein
MASLSDRGAEASAARGKQVVFAGCSGQGWQEATRAGARSRKNHLLPLSERDVTTSIPNTNNNKHKYTYRYVAA